jgi:hypothetical protein
MTSHLPHKDLGLIGSRDKSLSGFLCWNFTLKGMQAGKTRLLQKLSTVARPNLQKYLGGVLGRSDAAEILPVPEHVKLDFPFPRLVCRHRSPRPDSDNAGELFVHRLLGSLERRAWLLDVNPGPIVLIRMQMNSCRDRKRERLCSIPSLVNTHDAILHNATNASQRRRARLVPRAAKESRRRW